MKIEFTFSPLEIDEFVHTVYCAVHDVSWLIPRSCVLCAVAQVVMLNPHEYLDKRIQNLLA